MPENFIICALNVQISRVVKPRSTSGPPSVLIVSVSELFGSI